MRGSIDGWTGDVGGGFEERTNKTKGQGRSNALWRLV